MSEQLLIQKSTLVDIADAVRVKTGKTGEIAVVDLAAEIEENISVGVELPELTNPGESTDLLSGKELIDGSGSKVVGTFTIDDELTTQDDLISQIQNALNGKATGGTAKDPILQDKTITPTTSVQTVKSDAGYDGLRQVTVNAMPTADQATPSIAINSNGLITTSATQSAGYVSAGTKSNTKQLTTQTAKTITPSTNSQIAVASGVYTTGAITVAGDTNLIPDNIVSGKTIFGVTGTAESGGGGASSNVATFSVVNNLQHALIVNGYYCPVGETTNNIPYGDLDLFYIMFESIEDFENNFSSYAYDSTSYFEILEFFPLFGVESEDFIYDDVTEGFESCQPTVAITSTSGVGFHNICGAILAPPWDYVNDTVVDGATIEFNL